MSCIPVKLEGGRTWWVENDGAGCTPVLTADAGVWAHLPVGDLSPGMRIVVPAGDRTESAPARLIAAGRPEGDARTLEGVFHAFRCAARAVVASSASKADAVDRVRSFGARHPGQLPAWADGSAFTPREPGDLAAVFFAADRAVPELSLLYSLAREFRDMHRRLHCFVNALTATATAKEPARCCLMQLIGEDAWQILDDFTTATVVEVAPPAAAATQLLGRVA